MNHSIDPPKGLSTSAPDSVDYRAVAGVLIAVSLSALDTAIANTALPAIAADLHSTPAASVWIVNAFQLAVVATVLPLAALGDIIGHRRVYIAGLILFTLASLGCALAPTLSIVGADTIASRTVCSFTDRSRARRARRRPRGSPRSWPPAAT